MLKDVIQNPQHFFYIIFGNINKEDIADDSVIYLNIKKKIGVLEVESIKTYLHASNDINTRKIVINCNGITIQAQNALLKIFEDMPVDAIIYLSLPSFSEILDTLKSRAFTFTKEGSSGVKIKDFLDKSAKEKVDYLNGLWDSGEDLKLKLISEFLESLEEHIHNNIKKIDNNNIFKAIKANKLAIKQGLLSRTTLHLIAYS